MYIIVASYKGVQTGYYGPYTTHRDAKHAMKELKVQIKETLNIDATLRVEELNVL